MRIVDYKKHSKEDLEWHFHLIIQHLEEYGHKMSMKITRNHLDIDCEECSNSPKMVESMKEYLEKLQNG